MLRQRIPELMDDPALDAGEHIRALRALNRVNRALGVDRQLYEYLHLVAGPDWRSLLDIGAGGGGFLGYVAGRRRHTECRLLALDRSEFALRHALHSQNPVMHCVAADARSLPLAANSVDVVTSSLFLHHFEVSDVIAILEEAARVTRNGIVMGDLTRSRTALAATWLGTRLLSRSRIFHVDGPRSTRAAFRVADLAEISAQAGMRNVRVEPRFPFRAVMTWRKEPG